MEVEERHRKLQHGFTESVTVQEMIERARQEGYLEGQAELAKDISQMFKELQVEIESYLDAKPVKKEGRDRTD